ncbi:MAG TPA: porin [Burkholderiaceae bacterium]|nr:porin [Burkholderiaceae bacterium]
MTREKKAQLRRRKLASAVCAALGVVASMPAYADAELDALKQEMAAQRKMIDELRAGQQKPAAPAPGATQFSVYGIADVGIVNADSGFGRKTRLEGGGGLASSRLGMRATKTFEGGVRALAVAEAGVHFDTGSTGNQAPTRGINVTQASSGGADGSGSQIFARQIFAGLAGEKFGQLTIGRQYTGSYVAAAVVGSAWPDGLYGTTASFTPIIGGMPTRVNNSIVWSTPAVVGLRGVLTYTTGSENNVAAPTAATATTTTTDEAGQGWDAALLYNIGGFNAAVTTWNVNNTSWVTAGETGLAERKGFQVSANYNFGFLKVSANYVNGKIEGGNYENVTRVLSKADGYGVSMLVPIGNHNLVATYTSVNDKSALNRDGKLLGVGYFYKLFTDTAIYVHYGKMNNNANGSYTLNDATNLVGNLSTPGFDPSSVGVGLNYRF